MWRADCSVRKWIIQLIIVGINRLELTVILLTDISTLLEFRIWNSIPDTLRQHCQNSVSTNELRFNLIKFPLIQYWIKSSAIVNQVPVLIVNIKFQSKCTTTHHCRTALRIRMANFTCSVAFRMTFITTTTSSKCAGPSQANWSKHSNSRLRIHEQTSRFYQLNWGRNLFSLSPTNPTRV